MLAIVVVAALVFLRLRPAHLNPVSTSTHYVMTFAGDDMMQGYGASSAAHTVVNQLGELRPNWWIRNYSVAGASVSGSPQLPPMNASNVVPLLGDPVVVFLGSNDWMFDTPIPVFRVDYIKFIHTLDYLHPHVICVTPIWRTDDGKENRAEYKLDDYRKEIAEICTSDGHPVIDGSPLVPHDPGNYLDGIHPNDTGYAYYASNLAQALDKFLNR